MAVIRTQLMVDAEGRVSLATPLPAGEYPTEITVVEPPDDRLQPKVEFGGFVFPQFDMGPWPEGTRPGREEIYSDGDDGR